MTNEYLFLTHEHRAAVEAYKPDGVTVEISCIEKTPLWIAAYSLKNNNEECAKKLSEVHTHIVQYTPLVLSCESSEYFNRVLFPLVNEFERKLRKLLYLAASISDSKKAKESIKRLEEKDLGEIFDLLFIDQNFVDNMKKRINADKNSRFNGYSKYSKEEIRTYLDFLEEHTLWDDILGENDVPSIRNRFRDVQAFRNDVMHAHNISKDLFGKARYLFEKINKELITAICTKIGFAEESLVEDNTKAKKPEVNTAISAALAAMDLSALTEAFKDASMSSTLLEMSSQMSNMLANVPPLGVSPEIKEMVKEHQLSIIQPSFADALKKITSSIRFPALTEALSTLTEAMRSVTAFQTSPVMESIRRQAGQLTETMRSYQSVFDAIKQFNALQESLRAIIERLPSNLSINSGPENSDDIEPKTVHNENPEEVNSNDSH